MGFQELGASLVGLCEQKRIMGVEIGPPICGYPADLDRNEVGSLLFSSYSSKRRVLTKERTEWSLRVQVLNNYILAQNLYYNYYYPKAKYLIIGYMDPLGVGRIMMHIRLEGPVSCWLRIRN